MTLTESRPAAVEPTHHRPALDGVRAVAVGGVMTYHLGATWLPGGFLGVDLFFVLSGFLITSLLLDELDRRGYISFPVFFARRARRLLPAFFLLIIAVCIWAAFIAAPSAIGDLRGAALAALFYIANWFFILTGQSYFSDMQGPSLLEHTWSLSIEEQYYLLWPLLLLLLWRRLGPRGLAIVMLTIALGSAALMALLYDRGDPSVAYFGTFSRIHELMIGCLLALAVKHGVRASPRWRWTGWIPLVLIASMMATVSDTGDFYYRGGSVAFCVLAAWLILVLGSGSPGGGPTALLSWAPLAWIGLISYGLYLWHWPMILWLTPALTGLTDLPLAMLRLGATFVIAAASFYLIEQPIRRGSVGGFVLSPRRLSVIVPAIMAILAVAIIASTERATPPPANLDETVGPAALAGDTSASAPVVVIAGDSIPKQLMPHFIQEGARRGWAIAPLAFGGCSITGTFQVDEEGKPFEWSRRCSDDLAALQARTVREFDPDLVVWYSNRERFPVRVDDTILTPGTPEHRARLDADLEAAYQRFAQSGADIVIVLPVPKAPPVIGTCAAAGPANEDCALDEEYYASFTELQEAFTALANRHRDRIRLVRIDDVLCPGERECPTLEQQGQAVRPDGIHFSSEGASWFVPILFERIGLAPLSAAEDR